MLGEPLGIDEVVEQGRSEVQRCDRMLLDQEQGLARIPARLRDVASPDEVHGEERVDAHRVVERHHPEGAIAAAVSMVERLTEAAGPVGGVGARDALRAAGRAGGVEEERDLAIVAVEATLVLGPLGQHVAVPDHQLGPRVVDAIGELLVREPPRQGNENRPGPLRGPVEERRVEPIVEDHCHPCPRLGVQPAGKAPDTRKQLAVADTRERLELRIALAGGEERLCQVHGSSFGARGAVSRASSIAATMGA